MDTMNTLLYSPPKHKGFPKFPIRYLINRIQLYGNACVVEAWQGGNTVTVKVQRLGLFKRYKGIPFVIELEIDPTQVVQPPKDVK